jgi:type II secretory ATPase GspE/PulE/Tfp pilus assembly ATPase PilB-like protein
LPGNENTTTPVEQALPGDALPGDTVQNLELSDANSAGPATRAAGLTGMVTFDYNNTPITDIVNSIILDAIDKGVSDIHLDPYEEGIKIRIRIDGLLHDYSIVPLYVKRNLVTRIKIISGMNITESRIPQDGAIRTTINDQPIDIRVSVLPTNMGEKVVLRIMDYTMSAQGIDNIDFSEFNIKKIHKMMELPNGIILVTGATGSGKSTTVYSVLQALNDEETNIITVEDPVEMNIEGINQVQTQSEIGLTFASVLRSILRQDPDIIMVGEIRDDETARIAVRAAITGHLVLSTIHTNNALNTIERLTDMSVERYLLGSALSGIISQKLARRLCPKCKKLRPTTDYEKEIFRKTMKQEVNEIYDAVGCDECSKGYRGRIAVHEVLLLNQHVRDAITQNVPKSELRKAVYGRADTRTMLEDGLEKVLNGSTTFDEIIKLIDLDDDLGSDTQLGLQNQIEDTEINNSSKTTQTNNVKEEKVETTPSEEKVESTKEVETTPPEEKVETIETTKQVETTKEVVNEPISNTTEEKPPINFSEKPKPEEPKPEEVTNAVNSELSFLKNNPLFRNFEQ